mmetsp:Transcript_22306/g.34950  ORF Transcript_22306/g.34950 Transcript_22306/m.34950 type:complete len:85 (-) Transcript_22306:646-900(-)
MKAAMLCSNLLSCSAQTPWARAAGGRRSFKWLRQGPPTCPYEILEVDRRSNKLQIKQSYLKKAKAYHPDVNKIDPKAAEKFQQV